MNIKEIAKRNSGTFIDVRSAREFTINRIACSFNIPFNELKSRITEIKELKHPILIISNSLRQSEEATEIIKAQGVHCHNGGTWMDINFYQSQGICPS